VVDLASELGIIEKSGAWFSFGGERIGQGRENAKTYLEQHPEALDKIEAMVLAKHGIKRGGAQATPAQPNGAPPVAADDKKKPTVSKPAN
jgi:recombination protein RecA